MNSRLRNSFIILFTGIIISIIGYTVLIRNINPAPIIGIMLTPFIFFSLPLLVVGVILVIVNLAFQKTDRKKLGNYMMFCGIVMFFIGIYGFSTYGLDYIVSKIGELSFFFWLPTILTGLLLKSFSSKV